MLTPTGMPGGPSAQAGPGGAARHRLLWVDLEMTGLDPDEGACILEIAAVITDWDLSTKATYARVVRRTPSEISEMSPFAHQLFASRPRAASNDDGGACSASPIVSPQSSPRIRLGMSPLDLMKVATSGEDTYVDDPDPDPDPDPGPDPRLAGADEDAPPRTVRGQATTRAPAAASEPSLITLCLHADGRMSEMDIDTELCALLDAHSGRLPLMLCGSSVHVDRMFIRRFLPGVHARLHHNHIDVTTILRCVQAWCPQAMMDRRFPRPSNRHRALPDIYDSINLARYCRQFFTWPVPGSGAPYKQ